MTLSSTGFNETTVNQALGIIPTVPLSITLKKMYFSNIQEEPYNCGIGSRHLWNLVKCI